MNTDTPIDTINTIQNESEINTTFTPGQQLRKAREEKKLTHEEVSKQLSLSKEIIIGLENDDYSKIVAPVYARGYLVAYARLLQIPNEPVLREFKQSTALAEIAKAIDQASPNTLRPIKIDTGNEQHGSSWATYTAIAVIIIAVCIWGYNHHRNAVLQSVSLTKNIEEINNATANAEVNNSLAAPNANITDNASVKPALQENFTSPVLPPVISVANNTNNTANTSQTTSNIEIPPSTNKSDNNPQ